MHIPWHDALRHELSIGNQMVWGWAFNSGEQNKVGYIKDSTFSAIAILFLGVPCYGGQGSCQSPIRAHFWRCAGGHLHNMQLNLVWPHARQTLLCLQKF